MSKIYVPTRSVDASSRQYHDWQALLANPERQWQRGCSAMAAALSWEAARGLPPEIADILGPKAELLLALPEHQVPLPGGTTNTQCDVFALVRIGPDTCALAVEAKVSETFGPTIGEWLTDPSPGKITRIDAICALLGCDRPPETLRYQLFHRTAAAVVEAARFKTDRAAMIVQSFSQTHQWFADFKAFTAFLKLPAEPGKPTHLMLPDGRKLTLGWATGSAEFIQVTLATTAKPA